MVTESSLCLGTMRISSLVRYVRYSLLALTPCQTIPCFLSDSKTRRVLVLLQESDSKVFCRLLESSFFLPDIRTDLAQRERDDDFLGGWRTNEDLRMRVRARAILKRDGHKKKVRSVYVRERRQ